MATHQPSLRAISRVCECAGCGLFQRLPDLAPGSIARCVRCDMMLGRRRTNPPIATPLAFCVSALVLYLISIFEPLMTLSIYGRARAVTLFTGPIELIREGWVMAGLLIGAVTTIIPGIEIALMLGILLGALFHQRLPWRVPRMMRWYDKLRPWAMVEVYMLGLLVAYTKMIDLADVYVDPAAYALFGLMITMAAMDSTLDDDVIWSRRRVRLVHRHIASRGESGPGHGEHASDTLPPLDHMVSCRACGLVCYAEAALDREQVAGACPRCGKALRRRKPDSLRRTALFLFSAIILYIPANLFPIMTIIQLHKGGGHTILQGVRELYEAKMLPLALLVFFASITVPVLKIFSLTLMGVSAWRGSGRCIVDRTKLFRVVDFIGRWSMIDVFMVSILVALVRYGPLANVRADGGMMAFASVVVLTICAANSFDPRVMWDAAGRNGAALAGRSGQAALAASETGHARA
ncbi:paraquat-inducible protein A [Lichenicoccus sp.]|uniref:paraquat-inducible protein A n=1 Tax=Lichenicoccus sp. TaxID=2781899 RepID=UPI003D129F19